MVLIGGFHSPMERDCLDLWLHGSQPVIFCPAKRLRNLAIGPAARKAPAESRLLLFSIFGDEIRRTTSAQAVLRNDVVAALSEIIHAEPARELRLIRGYDLLLSSPKGNFNIDNILGTI